MEAAFEASLPVASPATARRPSIGLTRITVRCGIRAQPASGIWGGRPAQTEPVNSRVALRDQLVARDRRGRLAGVVVRSPNPGSGQGSLSFVCISPSDGA